MPVDQDGGSLPRYKTGVTYSTAGTKPAYQPRYSPPPPSSGTAPPPPRTSAPVIEAQSVRLETYPNEIGVLARTTNLSIDNDSETVVTFGTTTGRFAFEQGLARDIVNLNKIYVTGTPSRSVFEISGFVRWAADADGYRQVAVDNNDGAAYQIISCIPAVATAAILTAQFFRILVERQDNDLYYVLKVRHTAGAALNLVQAQFCLVRIK